MAKSISSKDQFNNELEEAGDTLVVANFHQEGSSLEQNSEFGEDYILLNINMEENQEVANSQGISAPTICCYKRKVNLTKLHVGFANANDKFKQFMTGYVASQKLITQTKKKPVEENNNQILDSDVVVGMPNHNNEDLKTKLEDSDGFG